MLYGGTIASIVDCHCIWTASAHAYRRAGDEMEGEVRYPYVTASLKIDFRKPVPIDRPLKLRARVTRFEERKATVTCEVLLSDGATAAAAELLAVRIPARRDASPKSSAR